jgi:hypothetical protein
LYRATYCALEGAQGFDFLDGCGRIVDFFVRVVGFLLRAPALGSVKLDFEGLAAPRVEPSAVYTFIFVAIPEIGEPGKLIPAVC